jgi:sporulation protein YlmC with PRC-barrel domain
MIRPVFFGITSLVIAVSPVLAQQSPDQPKAPPAAATTSPEPAGMPKNPDLTVATVKMQGGSRISKLIGSAVYNDQNEKIGSLDDLILKDGDRIAMGVVSVGGFLGMGNKLVAVPYDRLHFETDKDQTKITMPGASKEALNAMPTFTYSV